MQGRRCWWVVCLLLTAVPALADTWWEARHGDYHLVSQVSRKHTARIARDLQVFQEALRQFFPGTDIALHRPVTILVLKDEQWDRYVGTKKNQAGLTFSTDDSFYVLVKGERWLQASSIVFHELTHVFQHRNVRNWTLPLWLDEGYADLMSTVYFDGGSVYVGLYPTWRYYSLKNSPWMPLQTLLAGTRLSPEYQEENLAPVFYAQSWLLAHYHAFSASPERKAQIDKYVSLLATSMAPDKAFATAFPGDAGEFEEELRKYSRSPAFIYKRFPVPELAWNLDRTVTALPETAALDEFAGWMLEHRSDSKGGMQFFEQRAQGAAPDSIATLQLALAELTDGKADIAKQRLDAGCASASGFRAKMLCGAGYEQLDERRQAAPGELTLQARRFYMEALSLNSRDPAALIGAARTYTYLGGDVGMLPNALQQALQLDPYNPSLTLGMAQVVQHTDPKQLNLYVERTAENAKGRPTQEGVLAALNHLEQVQTWRAQEAALAAKRAVMQAAPAEVQAVLRKVEAQEYTQAEKQLNAIIAAPSFAQLNAAVRNEVLLNAGICALQLDKAEPGYKLLKRVVDADPTQGEAWYWLLPATAATARFTETAEAMMQLAQRWPHVVRHLTPAAVAEQGRNTRGTPAWYTTTQALFKAKWLGKNGEEPSGIWRELVLLELEHGAASAALEVAKRITSPGSLAALAADKRADAIIAMAPDWFDPTRAMERELERLRTKRADKPRVLANLVPLMAALNGTQKFEEAAQLAAPLLNLPDAELKAAYDDVAEQLPWLMATHADSLSGLQRWNEAETWLKRAAALNENKIGASVTQLIQLADFHAARGRAQEARDALRPLKDLTPYGHMWVERIRARAAFGLKDAAAQENSLRYLRENVSDSPRSLVLALFEMNRRDEAAKELIAQLRDPARRSSALGVIQTYTRPPTPWADEGARSAWFEFLQRSDIQAAALEVGRIQKLPFGDEL